jgi:hypothetical protein
VWYLNFCSVWNFGRSQAISQDFYAGIPLIPFVIKNSTKIIL